MFARRQLLVNALMLSLLLSFFSGFLIFTSRLVTEFEQEESRAHEEIKIKLNWILSRYETSQADAVAVRTWVDETQLADHGLHRFELLTDAQEPLIIEAPWPESSKPILDLLTRRHVEFNQASAVSQARIFAIFDAQRIFEQFVVIQWRHARIAILRMLLVLLVVGACVYFFFYRPLQGIVDQVKRNASLSDHSELKSIEYKPKKRNEISALVDPLNEAFATITRLSKDATQILEAVKSSPDACIICMQAGGDVIYANEAACNVTLLDEEAILRRKVWELSLGTDEESFNGVISLALAGRDRDAADESVDVKIIREVRTRTGALRSLEVFVRLVEVSGQGLTIMHARDVTERNELLSKSIYAERRQAVSDLARGVAHELNNGFQGIMGYAEVIEEENRARGVQLNAVESLKTQIASSAQLIQNLLTYSQQSTESTGTLDISKFVEGLVLVLNDESDPGVEFQLSTLTPNLLCGINPDGLETALRNIAENAVEASTQPCNIIVGLDVLDQTQPEATRDAVVNVGSYARITVSDMGSGIDSELQTRVFDPFFSTRALGQGLGLSTAQGFILQNRGAILLESQKNVGTTVTMLIPLKPSSSSRS
jgi:PAS domain S-box-containing protein